MFGAPVRFELAQGREIALDNDRANLEAAYALRDCSNYGLSKLRIKLLSLASTKFLVRFLRLRVIDYINLEAALLEKMK